MAESFENLKDILPEWPNEDVEKKSFQGCGLTLKGRRRIKKGRHVSL